VKLLIGTGNRPPNLEKLRRELDAADRLLVDASTVGFALYGQNAVSRKLPCTVFDSDRTRQEYRDGCCFVVAETWTEDTMLDALTNAARATSEKGHAVTIAHTGDAVFALEGVRTVSVE
jgi:hypothetical protein